ncbi:MAG: hypothetical protein ACLP29_17305 [Dissulfurispiraceae bacterium]|jgi:hypothetical protein
MQRTIKLMVVLVSLAMGAMTSFSQTLPELPVPSVEITSEQDMNAQAATAANKMGPGIVYLPIPNTSPVIKSAGNQVDKMTGAIDIASIVNFNEPGNDLARAVSQAGTILSIGGVGVDISSRSQALSNEWERYRMESSPQVQKGGIMARGVMAVFRIPIW